MKGNAPPGSRSGTPSRAPGRILHIVASGGLYGIERMLLALLPALRDRGCDAMLACLGHPDGPGQGLGDELSRRGVPVSFAGYSGRFSVRGLARLHATIRAARPAVVHVHGYKATILAAPLAMLRRIPTVATLHTEVMKTVGFDAYVRIEEPVLRNLGGIVAVSEPIRRELEARGVAPDRVRVIPNGIADPVQRRPGGGATAAAARAAEPVLLFTGRLVEGKDVHLLIDAVDRLRGEFPGIRLIVAGEGPLRPRLEARAAALGVARAVEFPGFVDDVYGLLAASTCFVLPSRAEGMPIALLEAMAMSVPIVATAVGSIPAMVRQNHEAVLVPPGDGPALLDALRHVLGDAALRARLGEAARRRFLDDFVADTTAARYLDFYASLPGRRVRR